MTSLDNELTISQAIAKQQWHLARKISLKKACATMHFKDWMNYAALANASQLFKIANYIARKVIGSISDNDVKSLLWLYQVCWHHQAFEWGQKVLFRLGRINYPNLLRLEADFYFMMHYYEQAISCYRQALLKQPQLQHLWFYLGLSLWHGGYCAAAEQTWYHLYSLNPDFPELYKHLGLSAYQRRDYQQALDWLKKIEADGEHQAEIIYQQALCLKGLEDFDASSQKLKQICSDDYYYQDAKFLLATMQQAPIPTQAPADYVRHLFDDYAKNYDEHAQQLNHQTQQWLEEWLPQMNRHWQVGLDLGCATGLLGPVIHPYCHQLLGVDISAKMLKLAETRQCYQELHQADIETWLRQQQRQFDLILCFDVCPYIGEISELILLLKSALAPGGTFLLTGESNSQAEDSWHLSINARYQHSYSYLQQSLPTPSSAFNWQLQDLSWRTENDQAVSGWLICASKST